MNVSLVTSHLAHRQVLLSNSRLPDMVQATHTNLALHATSATDGALLRALGADSRFPARQNANTTSLPEHVAVI